MQNATEQPATRDSRRPGFQTVVAALGVAAVVGVLAWGIATPGSVGPGSVAGGQSALGMVLTLALPTFLAGVFSFLSPCTLPILPAYFAWTFQAQRQQIALMTLAFFLGLATTLTLFGATLSLLGQALNSVRGPLTIVGGTVIMGLGFASMLGKGFAGPQLQRRPSATFAGSYVYGMTFALGWSACIGPILGAILTLLFAQGAPVLAGALLAQVYTLGLAVPLFLVAMFFGRLGTGSRAWRVLRGRGFTLHIAGRELHLHTTSVISGLLLVLVGYLLASGQLFVFSTWASGTPMGRWALEIETWLGRTFNVQ